MIELHTFTFNAFGEQSYLLDHGNGDATVVDPGMSNPVEREEFAFFCESKGLRIMQMLLTHAHLDHVLGAAWITEKWGVHPLVHPLDRSTYEAAPRSAMVYGVPMDPLPVADFSLEHGQAIDCGNQQLEVRLTPGHAPGHVVFVCEAQQFVLGGDVLFKGSVGRTDLPGCNPGDLVKSIETQLFSLPDDFVVWPGHGPSTTIAEEKSGNPFVNQSKTGMMQQSGYSDFAD